MTHQSSSAETAKRIKKLILEPFDIYDFKNLTNAAERQDAARLDELRRLFMKLISDGDFDRMYSQSDSVSEVKAKWNSWLCNQHEKFVNQLCARIRLGRKHALRTFCGVISSSPIRRKNNNGEEKEGNLEIDTKLMVQLVEALCVRGHFPNNKKQSRKRNRDSDAEEQSHVNNTKYLELHADESMFNLFQNEFIRPYRDAQYFTLSGILGLVLKIPCSKEYKVCKDNEAQRNAASIAGENIINLLTLVTIASSQEELDNGSFLIKLPEISANSLPSSQNHIDSGHELRDDDDESDGGYDSNEESYSSDSDIQSESKSKSNNLQSSTSSKKRSQNDKRLYIQVLSRHRRLLGETWLAALNLPHMPLKAHKRALQFIPNHVLPVMHNPLRFADYMTKAYQMGGIISLLALNGLFTLMTKNGLEYPQFYSSLYALIKPKIFYAKYRTRFFQLLNICLSNSQMLPAYLIAAFCKRLCHSALSTPPTGSLFTLALVSNLLRKHPECACLIHRGGGKVMEDVFDAEEDDPSKCRAIESSLWEISALEKHYHQGVAALAKVCGCEDEKSTLHDIDEFLLHTYKSLFEQESKRRTKKTPLTFKEPKSLFLEDDVFSKILMTPSTPVLIENSD